MTPLGALTDGDGWVRCAGGHRHWGRHGAAGLLLRYDTGHPHVLLQRRAWWSHHGGTWGLPGGARASTESPEQAALRETGEEVGIDLRRVSVSSVYDDDHGGWTYWTVRASVAALLPVTPQSRETVAVRWVPVSEVEKLPLHPGFAATWPHVR